MFFPILWGITLEYCFFSIQYLLIQTFSLGLFLLHLISFGLFHFNFNLFQCIFKLPFWIRLWFIACVEKCYLIPIYFCILPNFSFYWFRYLCFWNLKILMKWLNPCIFAKVWFLAFHIILPGWGGFYKLERNAHFVAAWWNNLHRSISLIWFKVIQAKVLQLLFCLSDIFLFGNGMLRSSTLWYYSLFLPSGHLIVILFI